jgi:N-acyl-D-amino-acid deacylase
VLRGGFVIDGTGALAREADVAVTGDRIIGVGRVSEPGAVEIDVGGLAVAPGFIDIHSHADLSLLINPRAESRVRQGVTTEVVGQDGSSVGPWSDGAFESTRDRYRDRYGIEIDFRDLGGFLDRLGEAGSAVNLATMVGQGTVRGLAVGMEDRPATARELERMRRLVSDALAQGAIGLSSGLEYTPGSFAHRSELVALAGVMAGTGLPYASHMRNEDDELLAAVEEALHVGRLAGVPVQISHLKAQGRRNWWKADAALGTIEAARASGVDVHFDRYPYVAYATGLSNLFPASARRGGTTEFLRRLQDAESLPSLERYCRDKVELLGSWDAVQITSTRTGRNKWAEGRRLGELATERGEDPFETVRWLLLNEEGGVGMIGFGMSEENTARILSHPLGMVCSDGGAYAPYGVLSESSTHPRAYGTFPRLLGRYVRERGDLSLEAAINKITAMPAAKLGLVDRGHLRVGAFADLVAFDPTTVADRATFTEPHRYGVGISLVVVNGAVTIREGEQTGRLAGRALRGSGYRGA